MKLSCVAPVLARTMFVPDPYRAVLRADPCAYCGGPGGTLDHIEPIGTGGSDSWENLTGACATCNNAKGHARLFLFLVAPGRHAPPLPPRAWRTLPPETRAPALRWSLADVLRDTLPF